jgi:cytochrome c-type biogenesis protein CcmF
MLKKEILYPGEHLFVGQLGTFLISLSFASALIAILSYYFFHKYPQEKKLHLFSRIFFSIHAISIFAVIGSIFFMMINHYFEYAYVWKHTDMQLEPQYLFAAFWEDQEGSFLLWAFWHAVIGIFLMFTSGKWEAPVMMTLALVQVWLCTMVMGIYVDGNNIGTNPFILMRHHPQFSNIPIFSAVVEKDGNQIVDYVSKLAGTARGMNPLLKNYWMTIHPPTLFLGFALTVVPFCFSVAGLMTGKHKEWQRTALPWTFAGVTVLGTGILMGGAWAYEALSFGGFWAWDPVENASLVPWLTLVGAAHLMLINKARATSFFSTYIFSIATFILVLYSTFLTRSGILGDSSVHAFTDLGMERLLIYFVVIFILIPVTLLLENTTLRLNYFLISLLAIIAAEIYGARSIIYLIWIGSTLTLIFYQYFKSWAKDTHEESVWSREFWIFMGSMVLFILAISISGITSLPVFNRIFKTQFIVKDNGMNIYNILGMLFGVLILFFMGQAQFLKYKSSDPKTWYKKTIVSFILSVILSAIISFSYFNRQAWEASSYFQKSSFYIAPVFVFFASFSFFANFEYLLKILGGKIKSAGASIAHAGFALIMLGCVLSNSGKRVISQNTSGRDISGLGAKFSNNSNIYLEKGDTLKMGDYFVAYKGKRKEGINVLYEVEYFKKTAEPGTKHFLTKDVYTDITHAELVDPKEEKASGGWTETEAHVLKLRDSIITNEYIITLDSLQTSLTEEEFKKSDSLLTVTAVLSVFDMNGGVHKMYPKYVLRNGEVNPENCIDEKLGLKMIFWKINPEEGSVEITTSQNINKKTDYIVMEAFEFPWINVLWTGCVIMVLGSFLAVYQRISRTRKSSGNA